MANERPDPLADLFTLFATPLSGTVRSIEQFRKGVDEFLKGVENFNRTMENLNETSERINSLLGEVEQPIRAAVPQLTRTVKAADEMMQVVSGPAMAVAPGLNRLAETLSTPAFAQLPAQISLFSDVLGEVSRRLGPFTQMAETAGGLFGGFRFPGSRPPAPTATAPTPTPAADTVVSSDRAAEGIAALADTVTHADHEPASTTETPPAKKAPAKKASAKKAPAKKRAAKKAPAKKRAAKKTPTKQRAATKAPAKKRAATKASATTATAAKRAAPRQLD